MKENRLASPDSISTPAPTEPDAESEAWWRRVVGLIDARAGVWTFLQVVALAFAGGFAIYELRQAAADRRTDKALEHATAFSEGRTGEARRLLDSLWHARSEQVRAFRAELGRNLAAGDLSDDDIAPLVETYLDAFILTGDQSRGIAPADVTLAIAEVAEALDIVAECREQNLCDGDTVARFFCDYATNFHLLYRKPLEELRATFGNPALGAASKTFEDDACSRS